MLYLRSKLVAFVGSCSNSSAIVSASAIKALLRFHNLGKRGPTSAPEHGNDTGTVTMSDIEYAQRGVHRNLGRRIGVECARSLGTKACGGRGIRLCLIALRYMKCGFFIGYETESRRRYRLKRT